MQNLYFAPKQIKYEFVYQNCPFIIVPKPNVNILSLDSKQ